MEGYIEFYIFNLHIDSKNRTKGYDLLIAINKKEKEAILERYPDVYVVRTMKQKSKRHRYYCVETPKVMKLLNKMRNPESSENGGGRYHSGKKR